MLEFFKHQTRVAFATRIAVMFIFAADVLSVGDGEREAVASSFSQKELRMANSVLVNEFGEPIFKCFVYQYILKAHN